MGKYCPVMNEPVRSCYGLQSRTDKDVPRKLPQSKRGMHETPRMASPFGYEKGRRNKSRS
jgi:hypothetical protein